MGETELREALRDAALWFETEAAHPRLMPGPAMAAQAARIREVLAASIPAEPEQADEVAGLDVEGWDQRTAFSAAERALAVPHRDDDQPCGCDDCMEYGAEDAGADWYRIPTPNRIVIRALDSGDERLAPLARAVADHDAEYARIPAEPTSVSRSRSEADDRAGRLAYLLSEARGGPWQPERKVDLWLANNAGDSLCVSAVDVADLLNDRLIPAEPEQG